jgi:hypothetical protein
VAVNGNGVEPDGHGGERRALGSSCEEHLPDFRLLQVLLGPWGRHKLDGQGADSDVTPSPNPLPLKRPHAAEPSPDGVRNDVTFLMPTHLPFSLSMMDSSIKATLRRDVMDQLLSPAEVAKRAGVVTDTVKGWERQGLLRAHRTETGRRVFEEREVMRFLRERERRRGVRAAAIAR